LNIYTKTGDDGETGLFWGGRVLKNDPRCEAYGAIDQAVSAMGLARATCEDSVVKDLILRIQNELFTVGAELATLAENYPEMQKHYRTVNDEMIIELERIIDDLGEAVELPPNFIIPGASVGSSALDVARSTLRVSERRIVDLDANGLLVNKNILKYINRLSDTLFMMARYEDRNLPIEVITGQKINE
jgi:cob(I)alamin adenosyltransferase